MEEYIRYISNLVAGDDATLQPVYGIGFETTLAEDEVPSLAGYRGMGPVRRGNLAWLQKQHDVYGSVVLASTQLFFDQRLEHPRRRRHVPSGWSHSANARSRCTTSPTPACGNSAAARTCTPIPA